MTASSVDQGLIESAAEWRLLSLLLERPTPAGRREIATIAAEVHDAPLRAAAAAAAETSEGEYLRLLGPGGAASPREVSYRGWADPGHVLAQVNSLYDAFGFRPRAEDPIDHVCVLAAFMGYLFLKEAFARGNGDEAAAEAASKSRACLAEEHLAPVAAPLAERLEAAGGESLTTAMQWLAAQVPEAPPAPQLAMPDELAEACGMCPGG